MTDDQAAQRPPAEKLTYEQAIDELERIVERIENGEAGLEESLAEIRRGATLIERCRSVLGAADQEVEKIMPAAEDADERDRDTGGD